LCFVLLFLKKQFLLIPMNINSLFSALFMAVIIFGNGKSTEAAEPSSAGSSIQDLLVTPTRLVFEGEVRTAELALVNRSNIAHTYALSFVQCRMSETGEIKEIDKSIPAEPQEHFADSLVRFTPRRVILEPRQVQMVRMMLRKPADLADGEYRSHLNFRLIPSTEDAVKPDSVSRGIQIKLIPIYGVTIPVIVRHGSLVATTRLSDLHFDAKGLHFAIEREGSRSTYGDLVVQWKGTTGKAVTVGAMNGVAVYSPNPKRTVTLALSPPKGVELRGGELIVRYIGKENDTEQLIAENKIAVP
jgi:P pilus assembly chaperone PapD